VAPLVFAILIDQIKMGANGDGLPPSLHEHYTRFIATARQSAPLRRIGTFGLAVGAACAFSLSIAGQFLTFRTRAWSLAAEIRGF
jgi:hypothetical protein